MFVKVVRWILRLVIPLLIIFGAVQVGKSFKKVEAKEKERPIVRLLVETAAVKSQSQRLRLSVQGSVVAAQQSVVQPQVGGRVMEMHPKLAVGGLIQAGEPLFRLEARDYELALAERRTALAEARSNLEIEQGQQRVAKREWELFQAQHDAAEAAAEAQERRGDGVTPSAAPPLESSLALRKPQLQRAQSLVNAAKVRVDRAQVDLERVAVNAPINGVVQSEEVELGQVLGLQSRAVVLVGTDAFWVQALIPQDQLTMFDIPNVNAEVGARVKVWQDLGRGERAEWEGRVLRLLPDLDAVGRMAKVIVEVQDPLNLKRDPARKLPLMLGAFVHLEVEGRSEQELVVLPRRALRDGDRAMVYSPDNTLDIRVVEVEWRYQDVVLLKRGLQVGEEVVVSVVSTPVQGMLLRKAGAPNPAEPDSKAAPDKESTASPGALSPARDALTAPPSPGQGEDVEEKALKETMDQDAGGAGDE